MLTERRKGAAMSPTLLLSVQSKHNIAGGLRLASKTSSFRSVWTEAGVVERWAIVCFWFS